MPECTLYQSLCPKPERCVTVDTNGYAPLFFLFKKPWNTKGSGNMGVQIEPLAAGTFCFQLKCTILLLSTLNPLNHQKCDSIGRIGKFNTTNPLRHFGFLLCCSQRVKSLFHIKSGWPSIWILGYWKFLFPAVPGSASLAAVLSYDLIGPAPAFCSSETIAGWVPTAKYCFFSPLLVLRFHSGNGAVQVLTTSTLPQYFSFISICSILRLSVWFLRSERHCFHWGRLHYRRTAFYFQFQHRCLYRLSSWIYRIPGSEHSEFSQKQQLLPRMSKK